MDSLVLRRTYYAPNLGVEVTLRLIGIAAGQPNWILEETGERVNRTRAQKKLGFDPTRVEIPAGAKLVPEEELPAELRAIRYCRWCGRYMYELECPFDNTPTTKVPILRV